MANYKESGVDVEEGYRAVSKYKEQAAKTRIDGLLTDLGSFNGMFAVPAGLKEPVMVSGTDGVGTKLDIAFKMKKYDTVGIDCVAMSVNDILCSGTKSLFFLDYVACGKLDADVASAVWMPGALFWAEKLRKCRVFMTMENMILRALRSEWLKNPK